MAKTGILLGSLIAETIGFGWLFFISRAERDKIEADERETGSGS